MDYSGHKHQTGEKAVCIIENNGFVITEPATATVNTSDTHLLPQCLNNLARIRNHIGLSIKDSILNLDAGFDSRFNRKIIRKMGMKPNIKENPRSRVHKRRGRPRYFDKIKYKIRFKIERIFAWEDKFRRLINRYETISGRYYGMRILGAILMNMRGLPGIN